MTMYLVVYIWNYTEPNYFLFSKKEDAEKCFQEQKAKDLENISIDVENSDTVIVRDENAHSYSFRNGDTIVFGGMREIQVL